MKKIILLFSVASMYITSNRANAQNARLQVIHNAADPGAAFVDIYINGNLALNDFGFRTATPFIDLPAGIPLSVGVAPGSSTSAADVIRTFPVTLNSGGKYVAIASGVLNPASFAANPDAASTNFTLLIQDQMREAALTTTDVDFRAVHGSTDAPTVDVVARRVATLVDNAPYSAITGYLTVPASSYILDVTPAAGSPIVASFEADLSTLGGGSAVVFASGFLNPAANQNGPAFGLFAALANGTVVEFPAVSQARLQVIHNAADPAAASVDVYINGTLTLDNFGFRTATPYIDVPAGVALNIGIAPPTSTSVNDTIANFEVTLNNGDTYVAIANGVLNPAGFAANPDAQSTAFTLFLQNQMREVALTSTDVDFRAVHGSTDAPTVDIIARNVATLVDNAPYSAITGYLSVPASNYILDITPGNDNSVIVKSYVADLTTLAGQSTVILASGFLNPAANQNGSAFALMAVLNDGTVAILPELTTSVKQLSNNNEISVYPNPSSEFIYINSEKLKVNQIALYNTLGSEVYSFENTNLSNLQKINISQLPKGEYILQLKTNSTVITKKVVKS